MNTKDEIKITSERWFNKAEQVIVLGHLRHISVIAITVRVHRGAVAHNNRGQTPPPNVGHVVMNVWCNFNPLTYFFVPSEICWGVSGHASVKSCVCLSPLSLLNPEHSLHMLSSPTLNSYQPFYNITNIRNNDNKMQHVCTLNLKEKSNAFPK